MLPCLYAFAHFNYAKTTHLVYHLVYPADVKVKLVNVTVDLETFSVNHILNRKSEYFLSDACFNIIIEK